MTGTSAPASPEGPRRRLQFGVAGLFLVMVVCSVMAAAGYYFVRSLHKSGGANRLIFILFTLVAPIVLMIVISLIRSITVWFRRRGV